MVEEILPSLYKIEIPLPRNPLKVLNSYVIKAPEQNLIIDTGMNREECLSAMNAGLKEIDVDLKKTDFFITHFHADHVGLVSSLATVNSTIFFNRVDADVISYQGHWEDMRKFASLIGFPGSEIQEAIEKHPGYRYSPRGHLEFTYLEEGDIIFIGEYQLKCVQTPGHTRGHMCLYEPEKKLLLSGDHILYDITPNISLWYEAGNPLEEYLTSLDKIYEFDVELVLPGHRSIFKDCKGRIEELKHHHQVRADEVLSILEKRGQDAYQVASQMTWDMTYDSWDLFPVSQKWFATGEAIAHLRYLEERGLVSREIQGERIIFSLK